MTNLDDIKQIKELDRDNILGSIEELYLQIEQAWQETKNINFSPKYSGAKNIIAVGMGGSALGPHIVKSIYSNDLKIPFEIISGYNLPNYADDATICLLSSYSGTTEEVLSAGEELAKRQLLGCGITTDGNLSTYLKDHNFPAYIFDPKHNPSGQPRMGVGYSIAGVLGMLKNAGFLNIEENEIENAIRAIKKSENKYGIKISEEENPAKQFAKQLQNKNIVIVASEFLAGNAHTLTNQINESAKQFADYFELPELNHHLMEGLKYPVSNADNMRFLFINSELYNPRVKMRYPITQKVIEQNNIKYMEFVPEAREKLSQALEVLVFGSYVGFYLAMLNGVNPSEIPFVKFFKEELKKFA